MKHRISPIRSIKYKFVSSLNVCSKLKSLSNSFIDNTGTRTLNCK